MEEERAATNPPCKEAERAREARTRQEELSFALAKAEEDAETTRQQKQKQKSQQWSSLSSNPLSFLARLLFGSKEPLPKEDDTPSCSVDNLTCTMLTDFVP